MNEIAYCMQGVQISQLCSVCRSRVQTSLIVDLYQNFKTSALSKYAI